jgi:predicted permease
MTNFRLALRTLFKTPFVTAVAIVSLALGIGANSAIFSLFNQMLLRPLPVQEPDQLVNLSAPGPKPGSQQCNNAGGCDAVFSYPMFRDLERVQTVFTGIAAHRTFSANLAIRGQTFSGEGMLVSGSYFPVLGVQPALGRLLTPDDDRTPGSHFVVVLSHTYWRTRFDQSPAILNESLVVNGHPMTIVGVAPRGFDGTTLGTRPQVFVPISMRELLVPMWKGLDNRRSYWAYLFARLKPGVSPEQARAGINVPYRAIVNDVEAPLQKGMSDQTMARFKAKEIGVEPDARGQSSLHREARAPLLVLLSVTGVVLLIACANIANLLLARAANRANEMAVRLSIGASRRHLVAQLLTESCLLAACGGLGGLLVARWTLQMLAAILPAETAGTVAFELDPGLVAFAAALSLATGVAFGLFPALHSTRPDLVSTLKGQTGQATGARSASRFRTTLATAQIALSMALLVCAGLFTKSLFNVSRVDLGVKVDNLVTFSLSPELNGYTPERSRALFERIEDEMAAVPGVTSVSAAIVPLIAGNNWGNSVSVEGFQAGPDTDTHSFYNEIGPGYFRTVGIPLLSGREFTRADAFGAPKVAIVNEQFAKKFNLGLDAVGKHIGSGTGSAAKLDIEIVGLVKDAKYSEVKQEAPPLFVRPYRQDERLGFNTFYVRTSLDEQQLLATIPAVIRRLDPNLPIESPRTMTMQVRENVFMDRLISSLSAAFAGLATLLAAVGLYGVLAYTVAQRTKEFGLRMALGADAARVRGMVLGQVGWMTLVGGLIGTAAAIGLGRLAQSLLFELKGYDPLVLGVSVVLLTLVALGAGFVPAHRASRLDPMRALRYE